MLPQKPREIAARILVERVRQQEFVEKLLDQQLAKTKMPPADRGLCTELVYGVVRWQQTLDWLISRKTPQRAPRDELKVLLRLGLYQMFWLGRIPDHAAVSEMVNTSKALGFISQAGFINAVLRGYAREKDATLKLLDDLKSTNLALGHSHPEWLVTRWQQRFGAETTRKLLEWNNTPAWTFARVNTLKTDTEKLIQQWQSEGVKFSRKTWDWIDDGMVLQLDSHPPLAELPSFQQGLFYVQDPSTLLSVRELDPKPDQTILDVCAAPGGKTTFIAQLMQNRGKLVAQDLQPDRLKLVQENGVRLGVTCVHMARLAEASPVAAATAQFDRILVDAPCSNTGVLRRRVELRWRIRPEEIERLRKAQLGILDRAAPRLKPGGILVYSTCSLEPEENENVIREFLETHGDFKLDRQRELSPVKESVDGAFVARLSRTH